MARDRVLKVRDRPEVRLGASELGPVGGALVLESAPVAMLAASMASTTASTLGYSAQCHAAWIRRTSSVVKAPPEASAVAA